MMEFRTIILDSVKSIRFLHYLIDLTLSKNSLSAWENPLIF